MPVPFPAAWDDAWVGYEMSELARGHSPRSVSTRRTSVLNLARRHPHTRPGLITKSALRSHFAYLRGYQQPGGVRASFNDLRSFFKWLTGDEGLDVNPMLSIPRPKLGMTDVPVLQPEEIRALLAACRKSPRDHALILLLLETGLRRSECIALNREDIEVRAQTAFVRAGKGGKSRLVCYGPDTATALRAYLRTRNDDLPALFLSSKGGRLGYSGIGQVLRRLGARAELTQLHPHVLRHTWTHYSLDSGVGESNVITLAGWSSGAQLMRYGRAMATQRATAAARAHPIAQVVRQQARGR